MPSERSADRTSWLVRFAKKRLLHRAQRVGHADHNPDAGEIASVGNACHAPISTCNSATNPLNPGNPIEASRR